MFDLNNSIAVGTACLKKNVPELYNTKWALPVKSKINISKNIIIAKQ